MVAVLVVDGAQRCRFLNAVAEELTGASSPQVRAMPLADVIWRGNPFPFEESSLARALADSVGGEGEETVVDSHGQLRPIAFRVVPLGPSGEGAVIELVDLTGETGTGRALRESEQRLRLAVEATGIGIWDVDAVTGHRRWSPEMYSILGLRPDAPADQSLFSSLIHPDERDAINRMYERAYTLPEAAAFNAEFRIKRANDGALRWIAVSGKVTYDHSGRATRGVGTLRDIHERRQVEEALRGSEERNRLAIEANDVGTWDYDLVSGEHRWSPQFKRLWGLPADAPSDPALLHPLASAQSWERSREVWNAGLDPHGSGRITLDYEVTRADDGARRWCSFTGQIFFDETTKKPLRALGIMTDVTERRAVEERQRLILREMNHRVKNSLALVQAIVSQTIRLTADPQLAFERIQSRLMSLARTHDFLNKDNWAGVPLRALIAGELEPFGGVPHRFKLDGPPVVLDSSTLFALGLTVHELASNAVRHGALSAEAGGVDIAWRMADDGGPPRLQIDWREHGGPPVARPTAHGFGSRLIEANVRTTLGGAVDVDYAPAGLRATLSFPLRPALADSFPEQAAPSAAGSAR